ncbi:unnamed protein product, partial [Gulo gulo]
LRGKATKRRKHIAHTPVISNNRAGKKSSLGMGQWQVLCSSFRY